MTKPNSGSLVLSMPQQTVARRLRSTAMRPVSTRPAGSPYHRLRLYCAFRPHSAGTERPPRTRKRLARFVRPQFWFINPGTPFVDSRAFAGCVNQCVSRYLGNLVREEIYFPGRPSSTECTWVEIYNAWAFLKVRRHANDQRLLHLRSSMSSKTDDVVAGAVSRPQQETGRPHWARFQSSCSHCRRDSKRSGQQALLRSPS
jgi:hypothetical protein